MDEKAPKSAQFAKERKLSARVMGSAVQKFYAALDRVAEIQGIDLKARLDEQRAARLEEKAALVERLHGPVAPLFAIGNDGVPAQLGSCVLVRLGPDDFLFTAAHVLREANGTELFSSPGWNGGPLLPLPYCEAHLLPSDGADALDVAVAVLPRDGAECFQNRKFFTELDIDWQDCPDDHSGAFSYLVLGYPGSRRQAKVSKATRQITQQSFNCSATPVSSDEYAHEKLFQADHIALDFDHEEIVIEGKRANQPKLQGVSGGGIFQVSHMTRKCLLVGIATQNRRPSRLIIGTRIKHFLSMAKEISR